ncbi:MAG TPA: hypothetical protein VJ417_10135, partial [Candidatus Glassbacteria bacterium]|nr:hypothetical protein [Candidatus Glassbacteria bacterium]
LGLAGLEVNTPKHDAASQDRLSDICRRYRLVPTGGTDYHGKYFQSIEKGRQIGSYGVAPEVVEALERRAEALGRTG